MLEGHVRTMRAYLTRAAVAAGFGPADVSYEMQGRYFTIDGSTVEVASARATEPRGGKAGKEPVDVWVLREVHDLADLQDGGVRPVVAEVRRYPLGQEMTVARAAAMLAVQRRIDLAMEEIG